MITAQFADALIEANDGWYAEAALPDCAPSGARWTNERRTVDP
jgi:hypothetical protein